MTSCNDWRKVRSQRKPRTPATTLRPKKPAVAIVNYRNEWRKSGNQQKLKNCSSFIPGEDRR